MAEGIVDGVTVAMTLLTGFYFLFAANLSIRSTYQGYWKEKGTPKSVWIMVLITTMTYLLAVIATFLNWVFICTHGWELDESEDETHPLPQNTFWAFTFLYVCALYLNVYVWIQRLESTFANSVYGYSKCFLLSLKINYVAVIIIGFLTLVLFIALGQGRPEIIILSSLFVLLFLGELIALMVAFIKKLGDLRKLAESRFNVDVHDIDPASLNTIKKLLYLQLKLTILATTQIITTLFSLGVAIPADGHHGIILQSVDVCLGFICVYCTIKKHDFIFQKFCCCFIVCCKKCIKSEEIEKRFGEQIEIHTQSRMGDSTGPADVTAGKSSNDGSSNTSGAKHSTAKSTTMTSATTTTNTNMASGVTTPTPAVYRRDSNIISVQTQSEPQSNYNIQNGDEPTYPDTKLEIVKDDTELNSQ